MKIRKIKHNHAKFFGWKKDRWARLGGINGKKRSYGHFAGMADGQTRVEKREAAAVADARQGLRDLDSIRQELRSGQNS